MTPSQQKKNKLSWPPSQQLLKLNSDLIYWKKLVNLNFKKFKLPTFNYLNFTYKKKKILFERFLIYGQFLTSEHIINFTGIYKIKKKSGKFWIDFVRWSIFLSRDYNFNDYPIKIQIFVLFTSTRYFFFFHRFTFFFFLFLYYIVLFKIILFLFLFFFFAKFFFKKLFLFFFYLSFFFGI